MLRVPALLLTLAAVVGIHGCIDYSFDRPDKVSPCEGTEFQSVEEATPGDKVHIQEPFITAWGCTDSYVEGYVKYLRDGRVAALVHYGFGACDHAAVKVLCHEGDCDHSRSTLCRFVP